MKPRRVQRQRTKGWRKPDGVVNVTRPSDWSNPFLIGETVVNIEPICTLPTARVTITRRLATELFRAWVHERGFEEQIRDELGGRDLMCWCPLDQPWCHAEVLLEVANP